MGFSLSVTLNGSPVLASVLPVRSLVNQEQDDSNFALLEGMNSIRFLFRSFPHRIHCHTIYRLRFVADLTVIV